MPGIDRKQNGSGPIIHGKQYEEMKKTIQKVGKGSGILDENGVSKSGNYTLTTLINIVRQGWC